MDAELEDIRHAGIFFGNPLIIGSSGELIKCALRFDISLTRHSREIHEITTDCWYRYRAHIFRAKLVIDHSDALKMYLTFNLAVISTVEARENGILSRNKKTVIKLSRVKCITYEGKVFGRLHRLTARR